MKIEIKEQFRVYEGKKRRFWEIRVDGKIVEITGFDPTPEIEKILVKCMEDASAKYCSKLPIPAEASTNLFWVH